MKRYLIFAAIVPLLGSVMLLFATTFASGYWTSTDWLLIEEFFLAYAKTLKYSYLIGVGPALLLGAFDDILDRVWHIYPICRIAVLGLAGFFVGEALHGLRGIGDDPVQFLFHGLSGFLPAMTAAWLTCKFTAPRATIRVN